MQGGQKRQPLGYTIVEVLIVLAVSSFMFLIAANFINGKQEKTAFTEGTNDLVSTLQSVLEDVTDGHYSDIPIDCNGSPLTAKTDSAGGRAQGTSNNCVFLGKLINFHADGGSGPKVGYDVYSLVAPRSLSGNLPSSQVTNVNGLTTTSTINQHLEVKDMTVTPVTPPGVPATPRTYFSIGFTQSLGTVDGLAPGSYQSGPQTINLVYSDSSDTISGMHILPAESATLCLTDGTRSAQIFIGGDSNGNNDLSIRAKQLGAVPCP